MNIDHIPPEHFETLYSYRISENDKERVKKLFSQFLGTKKYHNYSKEVRTHQMSALRYMLELKDDSCM